MSVSLRARLVSLSGPSSWQERVDALHMLKHPVGTVHDEERLLDDLPDGLVAPPPALHHIPRACVLKVRVEVVVREGWGGGNWRWAFREDLGFRRPPSRTSGEAGRETPPPPYTHPYNCPPSYPSSLPSISLAPPPHPTHPTPFIFHPCVLFSLLVCFPAPGRLGGRGAAPLAAERHHLLPALLSLQRGGQ